jgi:hypothetical protein
VGGTMLLKIAAVAFAALAVQNITKGLGMGGAEVGFVLFGKRLAGRPNLIAGCTFGLYQLVYAAGIFRLRRFALPMGIAYATYVAINLVLFTVRNEIPSGAGYAVFAVVYSTLALLVSWGTVYLLIRDGEELS